MKSKHFQVLVYLSLLAAHFDIRKKQKLLPENDNKTKVQFAAADVSKVNISWSFCFSSWGSVTSGTTRVHVWIQSSVGPNRFVKPGSEGGTIHVDDSIHSLF